MVIAVQKGLNAIGCALKDRGYEVVDAESYQYPIDAMVYEGNSFQISYISRNNMPVEMSTNSRANYGIFIINASGKSIDQIEDMLKTRYYSPLF